MNFIALVEAHPALTALMAGFIPLICWLIAKTYQSLVLVIKRFQSEPKLRDRVIELEASGAQKTHTIEQLEVLLALREEEVRELRAPSLWREGYAEFNLIPGNRVLRGQMDGAADGVEPATKYACLQCANRKGVEEPLTFYDGGGHFDSAYACKGCGLRIVTHRVRDVAAVQRAGRMDYNPLARNR